MVSGRMGWDAALHVTWNGGKHSFFTGRALVAHQSAGLAPPPHKPPGAEGPLTAFCKVTAPYSITGALLETRSESPRTAERSLKKRNPLTESFIMHQDQCSLSSKTRQAILGWTLLIFLENTLFECFSAFISFPSSVFFPLILYLMTKGPNQTAALFGTKLPS